MAISSCRYALGSAQSHSVMTTLRSMPCGRGGHGWQLAGGDPVGPVREHLQSALLPELVDAVDHVVAGLAGLNAPVPGCTRRIKMTSASGISRVAFSPNWWHDQQLSVFNMCSHCAWLFMSGMPLPSGPVPGNSLLSGTRSSENQ